MLTCKDLTEVVNEYLEGRMSLMNRMRFQAHLGMCRHCRRYLRQMKATVRTLGSLPNDPIPASVRDELLARFRELRPVGAATAPKRRPDPSSEPAAGWIGGWAILGVILLASVLLSLLQAGEAGPALGPWRACLMMEVGASVLAVVGAGIALRGRGRISTGGLAALGGGGALLAFVGLSWACPHPPVLAHLLLVHTGGVLLGALVGAASSRLPPFQGALR